jgi:predicted kinase
LEAVLFVGLPASGKSSFFKAQLFHSHVRVSLDLLRTRSRERRLIELCLETKQPYAVDNTNPRVLDRAPYITSALQRGFRVKGYYFSSRVEECLARNAEREGRGRVPDVAILDSARRLEIPKISEGFHELRYVRLEEGRFLIDEWRDEV